MLKDKYVFGEQDKLNLAELAEDARAILSHRPKLEDFIDWLDRFNELNPTVEVEDDTVDMVVFSE